MSFQGWPEAALDFFEGLEHDNSKAYWTAHRHIYDEAVLGPMTELTEDLGQEFGPVKIFRPYRDIRFSADKSPYRTEAGAIARDLRTSGCRRPAWPRATACFTSRPTSSPGTGMRWPTTPAAAS